MLPNETRSIVDFSIAHKPAISRFFVVLVNLQETETFSNRSPEVLHRTDLRFSPQNLQPIVEKSTAILYLPRPRKKLQG